jgi:hypothetical protein
MCVCGGGGYTRSWSLELNSVLFCEQPDCSDITLYLVHIVYMAEETCIMISFTMYTVHNYDDRIKKDETGVVHTLYERDEKCIQNFIRTT